MREKLETLSVSVLKEFAKDKNIKNISAMRKSELIDAILAANNEEEQTHSKHDEEKTVKKEVKRSSSYERNVHAADIVNDEKVSYDNRQQENRQQESTDIYMDLSDVRISFREIMMCMLHLHLSESLT